MAMFNSYVSSPEGIWDDDPSMSMTTGFQRASGHHAAQQFTSEKSRSAAFSSANPDVQIQQAAILACLKIHRNTDNYYSMIFHVFLRNSFMANFGHE